MIHAIHNSLAGIEQNVRALERTAERVAATAPFGDLAGDMTALITAERGVQANARALRAADETLGTLLDILV